MSDAFDTITRFQHDYSKLASSQNNICFFGKNCDKMNFFALQSNFSISDAFNTLPAEIIFSFTTSAGILITP